MNLVVKVVLVLNAADAVTGTMLAVRKTGNGYAMSKIGGTRIGKLGTMVIFTKNSSVVMMQHVFLIVLFVIMVLLVLMIMILIMLAYVKITLRVVFKGSVFLYEDHLTN